MKDIIKCLTKDLVEMLITTKKHHSYMYNMDIKKASEVLICNMV